MKIEWAKRVTMLAIIPFAAFASVAFGTTRSWNVDSGATKFLAIGRPSLLKIRGEGASPTGILTEDNGMIKGRLEVELGSFKTGIDLRDEHMRHKYLEVAKYPKAILAIEGFPMPPESELPKEIPFTGTLAVHGESQLVTDGKVKLSKKDGKVVVEARFQVSVSAHKIPIPSYGGVKVAEKVDVEVNMIVKPNSSSL